MTIDWRVVGAAPADVVLEVLQSAGGGPAVAVSTTGAGQVLVAVMPSPVDVRARPASGGTFANGVLVSAQVTLRIGGVEAGQYLLPAADVSGTPGSTLLAITPHPGFLQLDVPADLTRSTAGVAARSESTLPAAEPRVCSPTSTSADTAPLAGLAQEAAYAARRRVGGARLPESERRELHLAIDRSASVLPLVRHGSGQAVLDLLLGVNDVVGSTSDVALWTLGTAPARLRRHLSRTTAHGLWEAEVGDTATTGGTLVAPLVAHTTTPSGTRRTVVVLTDGPPADLPDLAAALRSAQASRSGTRWHVLALARSGGDPQVSREPWRDELHSLVPFVREGLLTCSALSPDDVDGWLPAVLADVSSLEQAVAALPFWSAA